MLRWEADSFFLLSSRMRYRFGEAQQYRYRSSGGPGTGWVEKVSLFVGRGATFGLGMPACREPLFEIGREGQD